VLPVVDSTTMLSFQKLDVYQRALQFLVVALEVISKLPKGQAELAANCAARPSRPWPISPREQGAAPGPMPAITTSWHEAQRWSVRPTST